MRLEINHCATDLCCQAHELSDLETDQIAHFECRQFLFATAKALSVRVTGMGADAYAASGCVAQGRANRKRGAGVGATADVC